MSKSGYNDRRIRGGKRSKGRSSGNNDWTFLTSGVQVFAVAALLLAGAAVVKLADKPSQGETMLSALALRPTPVAAVESPPVGAEPGPRPMATTEPVQTINTVRAIEPTPPIESKLPVEVEMAPPLTRADFSAWSPPVVVAEEPETTGPIEAVAPTPSVVVTAVPQVPLPATAPLPAAEASDVSTTGSARAKTKREMVVAAKPTSKQKTKAADAEMQKRRPAESDVTEAPKRMPMPPRLVEARWMRDRGERERARNYAMVGRLDVAQGLQQPDYCTSRPVRWIGRRIRWGRTC